MRRTSQITGGLQKKTMGAGRVTKFLSGMFFVLALASGTSAEQNSYFRTVTVDPGIRTESINCIGCSVIVKGDLDGEIVTVGGDVTVFGKVRRDIVAVGGRVRLKSGAEADADVVALGGMVETEGTVTQHRAFASIPWMHLPGQLSIGWRGVLALLGFHAVCILLPLLTLRPKRIQNVVTASRRWLVTGLVGLAAILVLSFSLNLLDEELHAGDSVELVVTILFLSILAVGISGITFAMGDRFFPRRVVTAFLTGGLLLVALELIPYLGFAAMILLWCWATGSALWSGLGFRGPQPPALKKASTATALKLTP